MEYKTCQSVEACTKVLGPQEAHKGLLVKTTSSSIWQPLAPIEANSPCACGCIYIVNKERKVDITSGVECPTLPISWTVQVCTVGKIYTPIFSFFRKKVVNITISALRPNESSGNFTFYRGIHEFLNPPIFVKITVF